MSNSNSIRTTYKCFNARQYGERTKCGKGHLLSNRDDGAISAADGNSSKVCRTCQDYDDVDPGVGRKQKQKR